MNIRNLESIRAHREIFKKKKKAQIKFTSDCYLGTHQLISERSALQIL